MEFKYWLAAIIVIFILVRLFSKPGNAKSGKKPYPKNQQNYYPQEQVDTRSITEKQLESVSNNAFKKRPLMNKGEYALFCKLEKLLAEKYPRYRIFPQVSMGEIIGSENKHAYLSINSKRVDSVIINQTGEPCAVVEYQGYGHNKGNAAERDEIKKEACRKAGIKFIEIPAKYTETEISQIGDFLQTLNRSSAGTRNIT